MPSFSLFTNPPLLLPLPHLLHFGQLRSSPSSPSLFHPHSHARRALITLRPTCMRTAIASIDTYIHNSSAIFCAPKLAATIATQNRSYRLQMVGYSLQMPTWLEGLLREKFFSACREHASSKKNERNIYCLDCSVAFCQHCLPHHPQPHKLLQIRRYVYHDVIRMQDIQKLIDCALVQPYIINSAKVVFLNQRPQPRPSKGQGNVCETCERSLQDSYKYCSVACKVEAVVKQGQDLPGLLRLGHPSYINASSSSLGLPSESVSMTTKGDTCEVDDEEHEEQEQLSPNSIFRGPNLNSPTSSSSTATEGIFWSPTPLHASKRFKTSSSPRICVFSSCKEQSLQQSNKMSLQCASQEATICALLPCLKRRKGIPRRSPIF